MDWGYGPGGPPPPKVRGYVEKPKPKGKPAPSYIGAPKVTERMPEPVKAHKPVVPKPKSKKTLEWEARVAAQAKRAERKAAWIKHRRIRQGTMTNKEFALWEAKEHQSFLERKARRENKKAFEEAVAADNARVEQEIVQVTKEGKKVQLTIHYNVV